MDAVPYKFNGHLTCGWAGVYFTGKGLPTVMLGWSDLGVVGPAKEVFERALAGEFDEMVQERRYRVLLEKETSQ